MKFKKLLIVIPTRNRTDFAINAVQSVLEQENNNVEVMVSDNSTEKSELESLKNFCDNIHNERLKYVRPAEPLSMPKHWEWAKEQALGNPDISHICYLTDRMVFRKDTLEDLTTITECYADKVISYNNDSINDLELPVVLRQTPWTGKLFEVDSDSMINISAKSVWHYSSPRMLNTVVPKNTLKILVQKYGAVFESMSPDFCFLYKVLDTESTYLHFDKSFIIEYGMKRSNGYNYGKGIEIKDTDAFFKDILTDKMVFNQNSPVPEFHTIINAVVNEYCFVGQHPQSKKFQPLVMFEYFKANYRDFTNIENAELKDKMLKLYEEKVRQYDLMEKIDNSETPFIKRAKDSSSKKVLSGVLMAAESKILGNLPYSLPFRMNRKYTNFNTVEEAVSWAENNPIAKRRGLSDLEYLLDVNLPEKKCL